MGREDADFAVCCAVPLDAPGVTIVARPAGRPGENGAVFTGKYGQSTGVVLFENVFVPHERIFLAGEWEHSGFLTTTYATHHRHSCIGARAGFGDLLIGAGVLMYEANGLDASRHGHVRDAMVELIKIVEGFFACGVAASVYGLKDESGNIQPDSVFSNVGKLLLATQIYDMQRLAHYVSGGLVVALPGPDEDHNPATQARLSAVLAGRQDIPARRRLEVARLLEDLTASDSAGWYSIISLHGGGSPEAMKREIWRQYPLEDKVALVEGLLERGVAGDIARPRPSARPLLYYRLPSAGAATRRHRDLRSGGVREAKGSELFPCPTPRRPWPTRPAFGMRCGHPRARAVSLDFRGRVSHLAAQSVTLIERHLVRDEARRGAHHDRDQRPKPFRRRRSGRPRSLAPSPSASGHRPRRRS